MSSLDHAYNVDDFRTLARRRLPRGVFDFADRGSEDELAPVRNLAAWRDIRLMPRQLENVARRDTGGNILGRSVAMPVVIGPTGAADILFFRGELALARAAQAQGIIFTLATSSTTPMARVFEATQGAMWLQIYLWEQRELSYQIIDRAKALGIDTLLLTVDTAVIPNREFNVRNGFVNPFRVTARSIADIALHPRWLCGVMGRYALHGGIPRYANYPDAFRGRVTGPMPRLANAADVTWEDVDRLRARWPGRLIVKGLLSPRDAVLARDHGADAVIVSNHGGRNLDSAPTPSRVVAAIRAAVGPEMAVLVDSGVRRGSDVVKAIALGADGVLIGKAALYALGAGGEPAVIRMLTLLQDEIDRTLALIGRARLSDVTPDILVHGDGTPYLTP